MAAPDSPMRTILMSMELPPIDTSLSLEEETLTDYNPKRFYPVRIGEVFRDRYLVVGKLGYSATSTVWLCRDLTECDSFYAVKVCVSSSGANTELQIYEHLKTAGPPHIGQNMLRKLHDSFEIDGPHGSHVCLVLEPLGASTSDRPPILTGPMTVSEARGIMWNILVALNYLHTQGGVIHTDIHADKFRVPVGQDALIYFENDELNEPTVRRVLEDRTIYASREFAVTYPRPITPKAPVLCDLSNARLGGRENRGDIMPDSYRAPEVILGMKWDYQVDCWSMGLVLWKILEGNELFQCRNPKGEFDDAYHLAGMVAIMGQPPLEFLQRSKISREFWDENGKWIAAAPIPDCTLEDLEKELVGEEKEDFLRLLRRMLCWVPEERATSYQLSVDPWVMKHHGNPSAL